MAYCTNAELTVLTGTVLSTAIQDGIIAQADNEINGWLHQAGFTPPAASDILKAASLKLSIAGVMTRHRMDGTQPGSLTVGEFTMSDSIDGAIAELRAGAKTLVDSYIALTITTTSSTASTRIFKVNA